MKILIDPVYTGKAHKCSTSYLAWEIIEGLSKWRDDCFFYLMYPTAAEKNEDEMKFLQRMPERVKLFPYPYIQADRLEEMFKMHEDFIHLLSPGDTPIWDYDVVITSRVQQLPYMRNFAGREANFDHGTHRLFVGLEEMPVFSFRDTVAWAAAGNMDLPSLAAYQSAGAIMINNLWTKAEVSKIARAWLTPSRVIDLMPHLHEVLPVKCERLNTTKVKAVDKELTVVFAGRMTGTRNFGEVADMFRKHFSFPIHKGGKDIKFIVSTNSMSTGSADVGDISFMEVQHNNRAQFHKLLKEKAHVIVNLSTVEDFSLSTYEPLMFGVPAIVPNHPWADFLGKDYPFRANSTVEAYAMVKSFATDYAAQMQKFKDWEKTTWKSFVEGPKNKSTLEGIVPLLEKHETALHAKIEATQGGEMYRELVKGIEATGKSEIDALKFARELGFFKTNSKVFKGIPIGKRANAYLLKVYLNMAGWVDTETPGVLRRP